MAKVVWPPALPQRPLQDGYSEQAPANLLRTATDSGPAKVRRRGNAKPWTLRAAFVMDAGQVEIFKDFVEEQLGSGARAFEFPHPRRGATVRARLVPQGEGALYSLAPCAALDWKVTLTLEVFDVPVA